MELINCDDVIAILNNEIYIEECEFDDGDCVTCWVVVDKDAVIARIKRLPIIESRPKGKWIRNFSGTEFYWYCSNCKTEYYEEDLYMGGNEFPNYCPDCGADMRGKA